MRFSVFLSGLLAILVSCWAEVRPVAAQSLSAGYSHTVGIDADGTVVAWGTSWLGTLTGSGENTLEALNTASLNGPGVIAVSADAFYSVALRSDGTVSAWGWNGNNAITAASSMEGVTAISTGGAKTIGLRPNGTVVGAARFSTDPIVVGAEEVEDATAVSMGGRHAVALLADGTVKAWGENDFGQVSVPQSVQGAIAVSAGSNHSLALLSDGTVEAWGNNGNNQVAGASNVTGATAVSAGRAHSLALHSDGTVSAWGHIWYETVSGAESIENAVFVTAGADHNYAVLRDGTITSWGRNNRGQQDTPSGFALPETVRWTSGTSADYLTSHLWDGHIPSTALSTAVFDQAGSYTVGFGNTAMAAGLNIDAGDVSFDLGSHQYQVGGDVSVATGASLAANGTVSAGGTVTTNGVIDVVSGGQLSGDSIGGSGTLVNNGSISGDVAMSSGGVLKGDGHLDGLLTLADGAVLAPGNSVGLMTGTDAVWGGGGVFDFEVNDAQGTFGGPAGWDGLQLSGTLEITATAADPFLINISSLDLNNLSGTAANFDATESYMWTFLTADGGIQGFDADLFELDWSGFQNDLQGGMFSLLQIDANSLGLQFNAIPEPSSLILMTTLGISLAVAHRRRKRRGE